MSTINWRERFRAAAIHFAITLTVSALVAAVIFLLWFPQSLSDLVGGTALFLIMTGCDVVLGPMLSLVIYSSAKPRRELITDYAVVGLLQLAALVYGAYVISSSRPVFIAFDVRRIEIVTAIELSDEALAAGVDEAFRTKSWTGPRLVAMHRPRDREAANRILFEEVGGRGAYLSPEYYRSYDTAIDDVVANEEPIETLLKGSGDSEKAIRAAIRATDKPENELRWLLAHHRFGFAIALIDSRTHQPVRYIAVNPTWLQ